MKFQQPLCISQFPLHTQGNVFPFHGNYTAWLLNKQKRIEIEKRTEEAKSKQLDRELEWIRSTPKAGRGKNKVA
jgi:ATPase subunit of ABC transporter with duplicated ATPase domains